MSAEQRPFCFTIMPFSVREQDLAKYHSDSNHWLEVYDGLIEPAISKAGLRVQRDDNDYSTRLVVQNIWAKIESADLVLCDLSSHNPNVHLELGWALRANKKLVLIKDELTSSSFDLNQYYTLEYSSKLQPRTLQQTVEKLTSVILATLADTVEKYSMIEKLSLRHATEVASKGSLEIRLLEEVLAEVQALRVNRMRWPDARQGSLAPRLSSDQVGRLPEGLVGSTWRKEMGLEEILFISADKFAYSSVGTREWRENSVRFDPITGLFDLAWSHDGFVSHCRFDSNFQRFLEQDNTTWYLVANKPYVHPSFGRSSGG
jgi:hypothetical protein